MFRGFRSGLRDFVRGYLKVSIKSCVGDPTAWERDLRERSERELNAPTLTESVGEERVPDRAGVTNPRSPVRVRS